MSFLSLLHDNVPVREYYMHLVDQARAHIEETYTRPIFDRVFFASHYQLLPHPGRFRLALAAAKIAKTVRENFPASSE